MKISYILDAIGIGGTVATIELSGLDNILSIICCTLTIISLLASGVIKLVTVIKSAKEDGKIDEDEIKEIAEVIKDTTDDIQKEIKK